MAESAGRLIAVGRAGVVLTTTDGLSWTSHRSGTRNQLRAVAAAGATVVAVGRDGDIVTSIDGGLTWALRSQGPEEWSTVVHGGGRWVAAGFTVGTASVMTSPDGLTWTPATVPNSAGTNFKCALWTGTRFVLGGTNFSAGGRTVVATSEDGTTWTQRSLALQVVSGLAWTGSRVVASGWSTSVTGDLFSSPDGLVWTDDLTPNATSALTGVTWTGTQLLAWPGNVSPASPSVYTSPTGETWTSRGFGTIPPFSPGAAAGAGANLVVGGDAGFITNSPDGGETWTPVASGVVGNCNALIRFAGRWVAAGSEGSLTSSADGVTWTPASSGTNSRLRAIAWHNGLWVAGGRVEIAGPNLPTTPRYSLFTSTDGIVWSDRSFGLGDPVRQIYSIIHAGTQWVATTLQSVLTSPDGSTWQEHPVGNENRAVAWNGSRLVVAGGIEDEDDGEAQGRVHLSDDGGLIWSDQVLGSSYLRGIAWTGNQFVAVGDEGRIYTSPTGTEGTWTTRTSGTFLDLRCVIADGEGLVAVGGNYGGGPLILTSSDGVTWTMRTAPTTQVLYSVVKAGAHFVATGYDGVVVTSPDAVTWSLHDTGTTHELYAAAWDGHQLLAAGEGGAILASTGQASVPVAWQSIVRLPEPGPSVRLTWPAVIGRVYDLESTASLTPPWLPIPGSPRTATSVEEFIDFTEPDAPTTANRFFRVRARP